MQGPGIELGKCWIGPLLGSKWPDGQSRWSRGDGDVGTPTWACGKGPNWRLVCCALVGEGSLVSLSPAWMGLPSSDELQRGGVWLLEEGTLTETEWYVSHRLMWLFWEAEGTLGSEVYWGKQVCSRPFAGASPLALARTHSASWLAG